MGEIIDRLSKWFKEMTDNQLIADMAQRQVLEIELNEHLHSQRLKDMLEQDSYYRNRTAIQNKTTDMDWKNNAQLELGLFKKLVNQKVNYLLALPPSITVDDDATQQVLDDVFDKDLLKVIKSLGKEAIVKGIAYSIFYLDEQGELNLFKMPTEQIVPFWSDERRLAVDAFLRVYQKNVYRSGKKTTEQVVEYWDEHGIMYYRLEHGRLVVHPYMPATAHFNFMNEEGQIQGLNWQRVPLIAWRYNEEEASLLTQIKSMIDNLNIQASINADLLADLPKFVYVLKNYGGEDLATFIDNLNKYMSIKVNSDGGVDKLSAEPSTTAAEAEMVRQRKAIYEAAGNIDTQENSLGNASGVALKFRYSDLDLDCNDLENEFQQSIEQLLWFIDQYTRNTRGYELKLDTFQYTFNRDTIINESEAIQNIQASRGILDDKTLRENHPWYTKEVEQRLKEELNEDYHYLETFNQSVGGTHGQEKDRD